MWGGGRGQHCQGGKRNAPVSSTGCPRDERLRKSWVKGGGVTERQTLSKPRKSVLGQRENESCSSLPGMLNGGPGSLQRASLSRDPCFRVTRKVKYRMSFDLHSKSARATIQAHVCILFRDRGTGAVPGHVASEQVIDPVRAFPTMPSAPDP